MIFSIRISVSWVVESIRIPNYCHNLLVPGENKEWVDHVDFLWADVNPSTPVPVFEKKYQRNTTADLSTFQTSDSGQGRTNSLATCNKRKTSPLIHRLPTIIFSKQSNTSLLSIWLNSSFRRSVSLSRHCPLCIPLVPCRSRCRSFSHGHSHFILFTSFTHRQECFGRNRWWNPSRGQPYPRSEVVIWRARLKRTLIDCSIESLRIGTLTSIMRLDYRKNNYL